MVDANDAGDCDPGLRTFWFPISPAGQNRRDTVLTYLLHGHPPLSLQLLLERVEEAPVSPLSDELLGGALDHPGLVQA